ncbi:Serpentine Receptor, class T [Aphelenchoides fujianensis]|nr:Serpentine Receptor, class T [Aphelenchoides fujianensis]
MCTCERRNTASYRLMILLGCFHLIGLQLGGLETGVLAYQGAVFCTYPTFIYITGCFAMGSWCASALTSLILGINRCCELGGANLAHWTFGEWRIWLWITTPIVYLLYLATFTPPPIFNGVMMAWFFNPHFAYFDDFDGIVYHSRWHSINNIGICCTESLIYTLLIALYLRAMRSVSSEVRNASRRERKIYVQVLCVGFIHFTASSAYVVMQWIKVRFWTTLMASTMYFLSQGFPPVIYLIVNRTLRNALLRKLGLRKRVAPAVFSTAAVPTNKRAAGEQNGNRNYITSQTTITAE